MMKLNAFFAVVLSLMICWALNQYQQYSSPDNTAPTFALIAAIVLCLSFVIWRVLTSFTAAARSFFVGAVLVSLSMPMLLALSEYSAGNRPYIYAAIPVLFGAMLMVIGWEMRIPGKMVFVRDMIHEEYYFGCLTCGHIVKEGHLLFNSLIKGEAEHSCPTKCWWW